MSAVYMLLCSFFTVSVQHLSPLNTFPRVVWVFTKSSSKSDRSSQLDSPAPYCAEHISVKSPIPTIFNQGTQAYCAHPLAKALQSGMSND